MKHFYNIRNQQGREFEITFSETGEQVGQKALDVFAKYIQILVYNNYNFIRGKTDFIVKSPITFECDDFTFFVDSVRQQSASDNHFEKYKMETKTKRPTSRSLAEHRIVYLNTNDIGTSYSDYFIEKHLEMISLGKFESCSFVVLDEVSGKKITSLSHNLRSGLASFETDLANLLFWPIYSGDAIKFDEIIDVIVSDNKITLFKNNGQVLSVVAVYKKK